MEYNITLAKEGTLTGNIKWKSKRIASIMLMALTIQEIKKPHFQNFFLKLRFSEKMEKETFAYCDDKYSYKRLKS